MVWYMDALFRICSFTSSPLKPPTGMYLSSARADMDGVVVAVLAVAEAVFDFPLAQALGLGWPEVGF